MAIRIREIDGKIVALCANEFIAKKGDIYLDDNIHHALTDKFEKDFHSMGFLSKDIFKDLDKMGWRPSPVAGWPPV